MMLDLYFAYFYNPKSTVVDGWHDRFCCVCDKMGSIERKSDYNFIIDNHYVYIGHYKQGTEPWNVWEAAKSV